MTPLFDPEIVATPLEKLMGVVDPNSSALPELSLTVGV
jgi:hypothetical protein